MKFLLRICVLASTPLFLFGCTESWTVVEEGEIEAAFHHEDAFFVVKDQATWSFLYRWLNSTTWKKFDGIVPPIDFSTEIVAVAVLVRNDKTRHQIKTLAVQAGPTSTTVYLGESTPIGPAKKQSTLAYSVVRLPAPTAPVTFQKTGNTPVAATVLTLSSVLSMESKLISGFPTNAPAAPASQISLLKQGICPVDGATLLLAEVEQPSNIGWIWTDTGYYCVKHGEYWIRQVYVIEMGSLPAVWRGPIQPGVIEAGGSPYSYLFD